MKKMNSLIINLLLITTTSIYCQEPNFTFENFENEFLKFEPTQKQNVSDSNFQHGKMILDETKKGILKNNEIFKVGNYWNIATAFSTLKENKKHIEIAFLKATKFDNICQYIRRWENEKNHFNRHIPEVYNLQTQKCKSIIIVEDKIDLDNYSTENNLDLRLVKIMSKIKINDQLYRGSDLEYKTNLTKQNELDLNNRRIIDSLFNEYKKYIGKSLVGEKFETEMWAIIQHSNLVMMEKYLPAIQKAVSENELHLTTLKMLLDRIHTIKYDYQIFGSQPGIRMADETKINEIKENYGID